MALVFGRRLVMPLWAIAFLMMALTASPPVMLWQMRPIILFVMAAVGTALIVLAMPNALPWLRASRSLVRVIPSRHRPRRNAAIAVAAGASVLRRDEPRRRTADDAMESARMDDDGGRVSGPDPATQSATH